MFTGIIQCVGKIIAIDEKESFRTFKVELPRSQAFNLQIGASISNDGCCLTITNFGDDWVSFDLIKETLDVTTLGDKQIGDDVNIERSAKYGDEIGGHVMSGHVSCTANIVNIQKTAYSHDMILELPQQFMKYILYKGFIGIDGASLTIGKLGNNTFSIHLIPETLSVTTLGKKRVGDRVNIEIDAQTQAIVDTVERTLLNQQLTTR